MASNHNMLESPKDVNEKYIHIGDMVHMLNTSYDGDHEWDDIVTSLEYVGYGGGDDWLVHGKDGAAWACECEVVNRKGEIPGAMRDRNHTRGLTMTKKQKTITKKRKQCNLPKTCGYCQTWKRDGKTCVGTCPHQEGMTAEWMSGCPKWS